MAKAPSKTPLIAAVVMVIAVVAGFNVIAEKYRPKSEHEMEEAEAKAQADAAKVQADKSKTGASPAPASGEPGQTADASLVTLGQEAFLGSKDGSKIITVGWSWTPDVQNDPGKVWNGLQALQKAAPNAKIHAVNTDEGSDVPDGVSVDGAVMVPLAPDGSLPATANAYLTLQGALGGTASVPAVSSPSAVPTASSSVPVAPMAK